VCAGSRVILVMVTVLLTIPIDFRVDFPRRSRMVVKRWRRRSRPS
jgi:hypothetical protein